MESVHRKPRFIRSTAAPAMRLTDRDAEIIRHVHKHRFLTSTHIVSLLEGSTQPILRRLHLLYHHGYLDRPRAQIDYYHQGGPRPMVYSLGSFGADMVQQRFGLPRPRLEWTAKNQAIKPVFLRHTLMVADVMVALERACRANDRVRLIEPQELATQQKPFQWQVHVQRDGESDQVGIAPDKVFALQFAGQPAGRDTAYFFLEADRATMPVVRHTLHRTSFLQKMLAYYETWRQQLHTSLFNFHRFRVLTVTTSPQRAQHILTVSQTLNDGKGSGLFLITDAGTLASRADFLTTPLQSGHAGEIVRLIDS